MLVFAALLVQAGDPSAATAILQQMEGLGMAPDTVMLTSLIMAAAQEGDSEAVLALFDELLQMEGAAAWMGLGPAPSNTAAVAGAVDDDATAGSSYLDDSVSAAAEEVTLYDGEGAGVYSEPAGDVFEQTWGAAGDLRGSRSSTGGWAAQGSKGAELDSLLADVVADRVASNNAASSSSGWWQEQLEQQQQQGRRGAGSRGRVLGGPDLVAWSALVAALVKCGRLLEAEAALERTIQVAAAVQKTPPPGAFGALIRGYRQTGQQEKAVAVLRRLLQLGVKPADVVWEHVIDLCLQAGDYKGARQVVRAMELTGLAVDKAAYDARFQRHQQQQQLMQKWQLEGQAAAGGGWGVGKASQGGGSRKGSPVASGSEGSDGWEGSVGSSSGSSGRNSQVERLKWWLGLPNRYYDAEASEDET